MARLLIFCGETWNDAGIAFKGNPTAMWFGVGGNMDRAGFNIQRELMN